MDIKALDVSAVSDVANIFLIASARSDRQSQGIASKAVAIAAQHGIRPISIEGYDRGHWILVDFGDVVLHVFYGPMREHYGIDNLWRHAPDVKFGRKTSTARSKPAPKRRRAVSAALVK
jgi:ribosome-associated protein